MEVVAGCCRSSVAMRVRTGTSACLSTLFSARRFPAIQRSQSIICALFTGGELGRVAHDARLVDVLFGRIAQGQDLLGRQRVYRMAFNLQVGNCTLNACLGRPTSKMLNTDMPPSFHHRPPRLASSSPRSQTFGLIPVLATMTGSKSMSMT